MFNEFKQEVMGAAPFKGDSLELLRAVYRGDYLATRDQIYAAGQCLRFERPPVITVDGRSVEQIREEVRAEFCRDDPRDALIASILRHVEVAKKKHEPEREIVPPPPTPAQHAPRAPAIDEPLSHSQGPDGEKAAETLAPDAAVPLVSAPCPETRPEKPVAPPVGPDVIEINTPLPHGKWLTRYVPRVK
jgi:hypothetical protein